MADTTTLVLVRHGQTAGNGSGPDVIMTGSTDLPLTERGVRESRHVANRLCQEPAPDAIYSSPLLRARSTADWIAWRLGSEPAFDAALSEIDCGRADGLRISTVRARYPKEWTENERQQNADFRWPGGESYREFRQRVLECIQRIGSHHLRQRVIAVTHAGVVSQIVGFIRGTGPAEWGAFRPHNGSITEVCWSAKGLSLIRFDGMSCAV